jgi:hypothetical protein
VEARHEQPHVLHQHRDQPEQQPGPQSHSCNTPHAELTATDRTDILAYCLIMLLKPNVGSPAVL